MDNFGSLLGYFGSFFGHFLVLFFFGNKCNSAIFITFCISVHHIVTAPYPPVPIKKVSPHGVWAEQGSSSLSFPWHGSPPGPGAGLVQDLNILEILDIFRLNWA